MKTAPRPGPRLGGLRTIRFRIAAAFLAALLAMAGAQLYLVWQQQQVSRSMTLLSEGYLPLAKVVAQLERDRQRVDNDVRRLLRDAPRPATGPASPMLVYTDELRQNIAVGQVYARHARHLANEPGEQAVLNKIHAQLEQVDELFRGYQSHSSELVALSEAGLRDEARDRATLLIRDGNRIADEIGKLGRLLDDRIHHQVQAVEQAQTRAIAVSVGLSGLAFTFSAILVLAVLYALRPIARLTAQVQRLAAGDYGGRVEVRGADEVAILADEFNAMVQALQHRDRTLVERAEQLNRLSRYLASVLDGLEDGLLVVEDDRVTLANPAATATWDARLDRPPPEALALLLQRPGHHEVQGPQGRLFEVRVARFGEGGALVVASDVTEQTRTREQLARSERLALVGQMLAQITHEVRNPLNALSLNAELLSDELQQLDPERRAEAWEILGTVASEIERLTGVTGHYLQLARRPPAVPTPTHLHALLQDVARLLAAELGQQGVSLHIEATAGPAVLVDDSQMKQAVLNVVRNAVEAGARQLVLTLERSDGEVRLALTDDGPGMTPEQAEKACEPFYSTKATGTGLGLAITRQILEDHGGAVRVSSDRQRGTTVELAFPERSPPAPHPGAPDVEDHAPGRR